MENFNSQIEELKSVIDNMNVHLGIISAKQLVYHDLMLDAIGEALPAEKTKILYTTYVNALESELNSALKNLDGILFDFSLALKQQFEVVQAMKKMKDDKRYISTSRNIH